MEHQEDAATEPLQQPGTRPVIEEGIYIGLAEDAYHAADGLSNSGMKHLAVSPLCYWHNNLNPACVREETPAQRWGRAVHCRLLEPERFATAYAAKLSKDDHPDCLDTDDDIKAWLVENGLPTTGKRKQERIDRVRASGIPVTLWEDVAAEHAARTAGMTLLSADEMARLDRMADVVHADPNARRLLARGVPEVSFFVRDPSTGVMLKARMDLVLPSHTADLKTFTNSRGKPAERAIFDIMFYERYCAQAVFYHYVREVARLKLGAGEIAIHGAYSHDWWAGFVSTRSHYFEFMFLEADEPFDLRTVILQREEFPDAEPNAYWTDGELRIDALVSRYAECAERFGVAPWREPNEPYVLQDADMPQLIFQGGWDR